MTFQPRHLRHRKFERIRHGTDAKAFLAEQAARLGTTQEAVFAMLKGGKSFAQVVESGSGGVVVPVPVPTIAFANLTASITEGDSGTKILSNTIDIKRNGLTGALTIDISYTGSAINGTDYVSPVSGTVAAGSSVLQFDTVINGDTLVESDEIINMNASLRGYSATSVKTITIVNDDVSVAPTNLAASGSQPAGVVNGSDDYAPNISGGTPPYSLSLLSGSLPPGRALNGLTVKGTYTTVGSYAYTLRVSDSGNPVQKVDLVISQSVTAAAVDYSRVTYFAADAASSANYAGTVSPEGVRDTVSGKTLLAYEAWDGVALARQGKVRIYDPAAKTISQPYTMFTSQLVSDDHGVPPIDIADNRRAYGFGGAHSGEPLQVSMSGAGDFTTWTVLTSLAASTYGFNAMGYPHPVCVGSVIYLFVRFSDGSTKMPFGYIKGNIAADGTVTWATTAVILLDFGNNSRVYAVEPLVVSKNGNEAVIRCAATFATYGDDYRQDNFVFDLDTAAALIKAITGTYTRPIDTPMSLSAARSFIRVTTQFENNLYGTVPSHCFDTAGNYQIAYMESALGNQDANNDYPIFERVLSGGVLGAPVNTGAIIRQRYDVHNIIAQSAGKVDIWFTSSDALNRARGGDISHISRSGPTGAWGSPIKDDVAGAFLGYDRVHGVKNADDSLRIVYAEQVVPASGSGGSLNGTFGNVRVKARSATGAITFPFQPRARSQAFAAALQTQPTAEEMRHLDALIASLEDDGLMGTADAIYTPAWLSSNAQAMTLNLVARQYDMTVQGVVTPVAIPGKGGFALKTDSVAGSYLKSNLIPSTAVNLKYSPASAGLAVYPLTEGQDPAQTFGTDTGNTGAGAFIVSRNASDLISARVNNAAGVNVTAPNTAAARLIIARRANANSVAILAGGSLNTIGSSSAANPAALANVPICLLGTATVPSARQVGFAYMGSAIDSKNSPIMDAAVRRFLQGMGAL